MPPLALPVLANLYSHTSVCLDSHLICHSQMSSSEAAMPLIWLPHPQGRWTQPCHHSPPTSPPIVLPSHRHGKSCTTQAWPAQERFPPLCLWLCVCVCVCVGGVIICTHLLVTAWKQYFAMFKKDTSKWAWARMKNIKMADVTLKKKKRFCTIQSVFN